MKHLKKYILITSIILIYLIITFITTPFFFVDYPCFVKVSKDTLLKEDYYERDTIKDLLVFISDWPAHASGGGCYYENVDKGVKINYKDHSLVLKDTLVYFDNLILNKTDSIHLCETNIKISNLWWWYDNSIDLKFLGKINTIHSSDTLIKLKTSKYVVSGDDATRARLNYITVLIFCLSFLTLIGLLIFLIINQQKRKKE